MNDNMIEKESLAPEEESTKAAALAEPLAPAESEPVPEIPEAPVEGEAPIPEGPAPVETAPPFDTEPWYARIEGAAMEELPAIEEELRVLPVGEDVLKPLQAAAARRRWGLYEQELADLTADSGDLDCAGLLALAQQIRGTDYPDVLRERSLESLHNLYNQREQDELNSLTTDLEGMDIPALQARIGVINAGPYTEQNRVPFIAKVRERIDQLHTDAMAGLCTDLEQADQQRLNEIRAQVEARDCAEVLKSDFFRRIEERQDALDLAELEELTANLDDRSPKELLELSETLGGDDFNPKFINRFRLKTALAREAAFCRQIDMELSDLDQMERIQILDLQASLKKRELPGRLTYRAEQELAERLYRVDLLGLLDRESNFDALGFEDLDLMRGAIARMDLCDRARADYLDRLRQREYALVLENTTSRAGLVEQAAAMHKVKLKDLVVAADDDSYWNALQKYWGGTGMEQPRDIPVFLLNDASDIAFSGTRFWYKSGKNLAFLPIADLERIQCMKHMLTVDLQIVRKDNTYLLTESKLYRVKADKILDFLNECLRHWNDENLAESYPPKLMHTAGFDRRPLEAPIPALALDAEAAAALFRQEYAARDKKDGTVFSEDRESWNAKLQKLARGFELETVPDLVWFTTSGLMGSMKEGIGVGPRGLVIRSGKQPAQRIPTDQIWTLTRSGGKKILLTCTGGQSQTLDLPGDMAPMLQNYFRTLQLAEYLQNHGA